MIKKESIKYNLNGSFENKIIEIDNSVFINESINEILIENAYSDEEIEEIKESLNDTLQEVSEEIFEIDFSEVLEKDEKFLKSFIEEVENFICKNY